MLKRTINYVDFNGERQSEVFYFNLTKAELVEMQLMATNKHNEGGLGTMLAKIVEDKNGAGIVATMKNIIAKAYGVRSDDGKRFIKSDALSAEFESTAAYSELFMELVTDAEAAAKFVNGIVPPEVSLTEEEYRALNNGKSPSDIARERSEAQMQGHKSKSSGFNSYDNGGLDVAGQLTQREVTGKPDLNDMSQEDLAALVKDLKDRGIDL